MNERLNKLKELLEELKSNSYGDQYGLADFVETNKSAEQRMNELAAESALYQKMLNDIELLEK